jgi:hypothetical protein
MKKSPKDALKEITKYISSIIDNPESRGRILDKATKALAALMAIYPPEGIWNRPPGTRGNNRWYERGYGSRWLNHNGKIGGINNSQKLNKSWVAEHDNNAGAVYTSVTYAPFLFDPDQRVSWARGHGWLDLNEQEQEFAPIFEKIALEEIDNQIAKG